MTSSTPPCARCGDPYDLHVGKVVQATDAVQHACAERCAVSHACAGWCGCEGYVHPATRAPRFRVDQAKVTVYVLGGTGHGVRREDLDGAWLPTWQAREKLKEATRREEEADRASLGTGTPRTRFRYGLQYRPMPTPPAVETTTETATTRIAAPTDATHFLDAVGATRLTLARYGR